MNKFVNRLR